MRFSGGSSRPALCVLVCALVCTSLLARSWNVEATGRVTCNGVAMVNVQVDLMYSVNRWDTISDKVMDSRVTDGTGTFNLRGAGGSIFGPPPSYVRVVYHSRVGDPVVQPLVDAFVTSDTGAVRSDHNDTRAFPWSPGVINMGTQNFRTLDCALWTQIDSSLQDYKSAIDGTAPLPYTSLDVRHSDIIFAGDSFSLLRMVLWPKNHPPARWIVFHEVGHTVRHSYDGDTAHFLTDVARFNYLRTHNPSDLTNEGFAFNEGWSEMWETRRTVPPRALSPINSPPNTSVEGDVAGLLRRLAECVGFANVARVLHVNRGAIHSYGEFLAAYKRMFPGACEPPPPPAPTPGGCADGTVDQQFYDGMVGCAGRATFRNAAALCGRGFHLATAAEWVQKHRHLKPEHNYWTADILTLDDYIGKCAARIFPAGTNCHDSALHFCVPNPPMSGDARDPEGNNCRRDVNECLFNPAVGEEFPPVEWLGGCGPNDDTAGAVCVMDATLDAAPVPDAGAKARDREVLVRRIDDLVARLATARQMAVLPSTCAEQTGCGPELEALIQPALIEGAIAMHRAWLARFDAAPATMFDFVRKGEDGRRDFARSYVLEIVTIQKTALANAIKALDPALRNAATKSAAAEAIAELQSQIADLDAVAKDPDHPSPNFEGWDAVTPWP